ncbi:MAG: hypothetical protein QXG00_06955 [Candidatus Woesearchaeota archaeon]
MHIVYSPELSISNEQISLSKPQHVFRTAIHAEDEVLNVEPFKKSEFYLCHDKKYVDGVFSGTTVNGFGTTSKTYLNQICHTSSAFYKAALTAYIKTDCGNIGIVPALVSGFHHAHYDYGRGYCTFNGLVLTAMKMKRLRHLNKIAIIDLDGHYGDGTEDIINRLQISDWLHNYTHYKNIPRNIGDLIKFLENFPYINYDLILYQAGADAHIDDPYKVGYLDDVAWSIKDNIIFSSVAKYKIPLAFNLAGGYNGDKTIELHAMTLENARKINK